MIRYASVLSRLVIVFFLGTGFTGTIEAAVAVKVFSMDEGLAESNISKPRIYIQNTGTETIDDFCYRYYFETEDDKQPLLEEYYTPNATVLVAPNGNGYYLQYNVTGANLAPGGLLPHSAGNVVGIHYPDWFDWDNGNDFSNNMSATFQENPNIAVFYNNARIYGNEPGGIAGSVLKEVWINISGTSTDAIDLNTTPWLTVSQESLDGPVNIADNYGVRLRGYITAPTSGDYTFFIASDDNAKLFLSSDNSPENKALIASVSSWTGYQSWYQFSSQQSAPLTLVAGSKYYVEILHKEGAGGDHCSVGWLTPGQTGTPQVVPGTVLTPYVPQIVPAVPSLSATVQSANTINLSWNNVNNELGYKIQMASGGGGFAHLVTLTADVTSFLVTGLEPETEYRFKVLSYNATGESEYSNAALATTFAVIAGKATREIWYGISGIAVSDIPVNSPANTVEDLYQLETPQQFSDYYGQRIRGYIIPPSTGDYLFWIASDDRSQLLLSNDDDPGNKQIIASVEGYCSYRQWDKYPATQKSGVKNLTAGVRYYFEVLHKDGTQNDNLSVGWAKPGQSTGAPSEVVPGTVLSPYSPPTIPDNPSALSAEAISATQIDVDWTDNSDNELGFRIERALGDEEFQLVYTTAANVTVFHDAGLNANTQYRYRVLAFNGEGNSDYTGIVTEITLDQSSPPPPKELALNSFGLYSSIKTELRDNCVFSGGGAIGSNTYVELLPLSITNGSVVCGGDILLRPQAEVMEDATAGGTVTLESSAIVHGDVTEGATVAIITIPEKTDIETGTQDITVNVDEDYGTLQPGIYKDLWVGDRGTITLTAGRYTFTSLFLSTDTKIDLDIDMTDVVEIEIDGDLEFSDRSQVTFLEDGYIPFVRMYTNDDNMVRIGCDVQINGMLTAPHGDVHIYSRAQCNGAIYAKIITIEPEAIINSGAVVNQCGDSDGDHIQDIIEVIIGTDPNDASSYKMIAIPSEACIDNSEEVTVTYDFSYYFRDYAFADQMEATFPAGALARPFIPLIPQITNLPTSGNPYTDTSTNRIGRYISFTDDNWLADDAEFTFQLPYDAGLAKTSYDPYQDDGYGTFNLAPVAGEQIYSKTASLGTTNSILFIGPKKEGGKTLYFPGNYVYSNSNQAVFLAVLHIRQSSPSVTGIHMRVEYTDYSGGTPATGRTFEDDLELEDGVFHLGKKYRKADLIKINQIDLVLERESEPDHTYSIPLGTDAFPISGAQCGYMAMVHSTEKGFIRTTDKLLTTPANTSLMECGYYPDDVTFESVNLGEGRMVADLTGQGDETTFEYFLTDHLRSTRMVLSDDEVIKEAVMYTPYGMMSPVAGVTAPMPVREKFTTKEFDEEGGSVAGVGDGLNLFYFGARYYDPEIGLWMGPDPARQFFNTYAYSGNGTNPLTFFDPLGLELRLYFVPTTYGGQGYHVFVYSTELKEGKGRNGAWGKKINEGWDLKFIKDPKTNGGKYIVIEDLNGMTEEEAFKKLKKYPGWNEGGFMFGVDDCHTQMKEAFDYAGLDYPTESEGNPGRFESANENWEAVANVLANILLRPIYGPWGVLLGNGRIYDASTNMIVDPAAADRDDHTPGLKVKNEESGVETDPNGKKR